MWTKSWTVRRHPSRGGPMRRAAKGAGTESGAAAPAFSPDLGKGLLSTQYVYEKAHMGILGCADEQGAVEEDVVVLAARLREHHTGVAGRQVRPAGAGGLGFDAERVRGTPLGTANGRTDRPVEKVGSPWATSPPRLPAESLVAV